MSKTWLITGASSGFGRAMTEQLLARGDRVIATLRKMQALEDLQARHGERLAVVALDVVDGDAVRRVVDDAFASGRRIDVVVANAAYGSFGAAEEFSDEQLRHIVDTNILGSIRLIRAALPHLRAQGGGRILQISSEGGQIAYPAFSLYHATKWAVEGFVESVAQETAPFGIEFTLVEPGPTATGFRSGMVQPATLLAAYDDTPVGTLRRASGLTRTGDVDKMVRAMVASVDQAPAPKRLVLGAGPYDRIHAALTQRLAALESQQALARSTDIDPPAAA